jgi:hypothetical protein
VTDENLRDGELHARVVIEEVLIFLIDNKLSSHEELINALNWWAGEVYEAFPCDKTPNPGIEITETLQ